MDTIFISFFIERFKVFYFLFLHIRAYFWNIFKRFLNVRTYEPRLLLLLLFTSWNTHFHHDYCSVAILIIAIRAKSDFLSVFRLLFAKRTRIRPKSINLLAVGGGEID